MAHSLTLGTGGSPLLVLDSPGGSARAAFRIATLLRKHRGGFIAVIPRYAKSAATLLALGAERIVIHEFAELGPLDAQYMDHDRELYTSALDEVQALERLHARALEAVDETMFVLSLRSGKRLDTLLPMAMNFVADTMRPLMERIDTVHYSLMSRSLKVAEEYAIRLLRPAYGDGDAKRIARHLVEAYPEHGFLIDADEANSFGLRVEVATGTIATALTQIERHTKRMTVIGRLGEVTTDA